MIVIYYKESEMIIPHYVIIPYYPHHQRNHCHRGQNDRVPILGDEVPQVLNAAV